MGEIWDLIGSKLASILFIWAMVQKFCPYQVHEFIKKISNKLASLFDPYVEVRFFEYIGDFRKTNEAFSVIEHYLTSKSTNQSKKLQGEFVKNSLVLKIDESEEFHDEFEGIKLPLKQLQWIQKIREIVDDLIRFSKSKDYYARIGKPWKRGYLLYGPPGTGKSSLVAAIANFLKYDIYDIELTNVKTNAELRKLLIGITSKSVVVIEDIDCSLDLTGQRKTDSDNGKEKEEKKEENQVVASLDELKSEAAAENNKISQVTLSGLLNFIDGIWSASTGERLIIFTTNYVEKLDHALIRRGRMDMHIELSYCGFDGFKMLAMNYLSLESDFLFETIRSLLEETNMTPADVAENLMPKVANEDVETSLERLIQALRSSKEVAEKKEGTSGEDTSKKEAEDAEDKELDEEIDNRKS
ncbi:hypothetical protein P8452_05471 [Trifolium repens]|nr:hypothetical protein P8452_05471 [Trifolium repens]